MKAVWKQPLNHGVTDFFSPVGAKPLAVALQGDQIMLWQLVDTEAAKVGRRYMVAGTGHPLPDAILPSDYVGTVQQGPFVWHVFNVTN